MTVSFSQVILHNRKNICFIIVIKWITDKINYTIHETNPLQDKFPTFWNTSIQISSIIF
jgi:hypothetical protein